jgi:hypothetical protein
MTTENQQIFALSGFYIRGYDVELTGNSNDLSKLIEVLTSNEQKTLIGLFEPPQPNLSNTALETIEIVKGNGDILISVHNHNLHVSGSQKNMLILANNIKWLIDSIRDGKNSNHIHIDYYEDHPFLSSSSLSLIISVS